ncbi:MAG TPA: hypothetical protein VIZ18_04680, partial [Ktedonobacteraceae bacterium]
IVIRVGPSRQRKILTPLLALLGLLIMLALLIGVHISLTTNSFALVLCIALVTLLWLRRMYRGQSDLRKDRLISSFKVNITILLIILVCVSTGFAPQPDVLLNTLAFALPIFFLSSFLAFSLLRLVQVRREHQSFLHSRLSSNPTRQWTITLVILWGVLAALLFLFQTFLFPLLAFLFTPLGNAAYALFWWLINFFLSLLHSQGVVLVRKKPPILRPRPKIPLISPHYVVIVIICALLAVLLLALVAYWLYHAHEDAVRKRFLSRSRGQRHRKQSDKETESEELDPMSARAHYRGFLREVAKRDETLGHRQDETPIEYQGRLLSSLKPDAHNQQPDAPSDPLILDELTRAYSIERYAGEQTDTRQRLYLHIWMPYLVQHLAGNRLTHNLKRRLRWMLR